MPAIPITQEIHKLAPTALLELFQLDVPAVGAHAAFTLYFHIGTNKLKASVTWNSQAYTYYPIEITGFDTTSQGNLPSPTARVANVAGTISAYIRDYNDLVGAKVTRRLVFARFLDAVNFPQGNADADPTVTLPEEIYYVDQKSAENANLVEFKLVSALELSRVTLPLRKIIATACVWKFRSDLCGATVGYDGSGDPDTDYDWNANRPYYNSPILFRYGSDPLKRDYYKYETVYIDYTPSDPHYAVGNYFTALANVPMTSADLFPELNIGTYWQAAHQTNPVNFLVWYDGSLYRNIRDIDAATGASAPDVATSFWTSEFCDHSIVDCRRFFSGTGVLRFGGFPGAAKIPRI